MFFEVGKIEKLERYILESFKLENPEEKWVSLNFSSELLSNFNKNLPTSTSIFPTTLIFSNFFQCGHYIVNHVIPFIKRFTTILNLLTDSHVVRSHGRPDFPDCPSDRNGRILTNGVSNDIWTIDGYGTVVR